MLHAKPTWNCNLLFNSDVLGFERDMQHHPQDDADLARDQDHCKFGPESRGKCTGKGRGRGRGRRGRECCVQPN
jgi:hypothetical protein